MIAPLHQKEEARLHELENLRVLDSDPEAEFDNLVSMARDVFDVPIAYVSLVAEHRQWLKSKIGVDVCETSRDIALCAHAILESEPLVINDTTLDDRFIDNPLVTGDLHVRFYAGAQILINGLPIGTFCCVDTEPRHFTEEQIRALKGFAQQAATLLDWRLSAKRLAESEQRLASFLDNAPMHAYLKDKEGRMRYANKFFRDMIGKTNEEMIGLTSDNWFPPKVAAQARMSDLSVLSSQQAIDFEASFTTLYGKETAMRGSKFPLEVDGEQMVAGVAIDVTALREAEATLNVQNMLLKERTNELSDALAFAKQLEATSRIAAARFEHLFSGLPVACFSYDVKGVIQEWNAAAERVTGIPAHEAILKPVLGTAVCEVNAAEFREVALRVLAGEIVPNIERREIMKDGSVKWLLSSNIPLTNGAGVVIGGLSASIDVTERKLVEAALEKSEARFRTAIHSMHEGLIVQNCNGDILLCNESSAQILGLSLDQLHGLNSRDPRWRAVRQDSSPWEPEEHPSMVALRTGIEQKDQTMGIHMPSGELSWILLNAVPLFLEGCPEPYAVVVTFRDISERHRFEEMIAKQLGQIQQYAGELEEANVKLQSLASTDGLTASVTIAPSENNSIPKSPSPEGETFPFR